MRKSLLPFMVAATGLEVGCNEGKESQEWSGVGVEELAQRKDVSLLRLATSATVLTTAVT